MNRASGIVRATKSSRRHDVRRVVEVVGRVDLGRADRVDDAEDRDQAGVLLQRDEVVEQRRHDPAHAPAAARRGAWSGRARGRASGPRRAGSGCTDSMPARKPRRRRPSTTATSAMAPQNDRCRQARAAAAPGTPKPSEEEHEQQRQAAEQVDVDRRARAAAGRRPAAAGCARRPATRPSDQDERPSAIRKSRTLSQRPSSTPGSDVDARCRQLKNVSWTRGQPGRGDDEPDDQRRPRRPC